MRTAQIVTGAIAFLALPAALAQNLTQTRTGYNSVNVYAQQRIDLVSTATPTVTAFEASAGFEAVIKLPEATAGRWSAPARWTDYRREGANTAITGMVGIHTHVLPNGYVFSWEGHNLDTKAAGNASCTSHAYAWNPNPGARLGSAVYPNIYADYDNFNVNIFCGGHTLLADGRLLVAGGHYSAGDVDRSFNRIPPPGHYDTNAGLSQPIEAYRVSTPSDPEYVPPTSSFTPFNPNVNSYIGTRDLNIFNYRVGVPPPANNTGWQTSFFGVLPAMKYRRWYPTATTLADGRVLVVAGQRFGGPLGITPATTVQAEIPELYTPNASYSQTWTELTNASRRLPLYPWMFLAPDGRVFNAGPNLRTGFLNPTTATWTDGPPHLYAPYAQANPLPMGAPRPYDYTERGAGSAVMYARGKILILGGANASSVTNTAETIDINNPSANPQFQQAAPMAFARTHVNATVLADGTVLATGGTSSTGNSDTGAVMPAEQWTPPASGTGPGTWTTMNAMMRPRLYHSTAVLLPDATVLSTGGGQGGNFTDHHDYEIFTPPYLCQPGTSRPVIGYGPRAIAYGQSFTIFTPDAATITRATWVRLSSVTHSFNMNQRFLDLNVAYDGSQPGQLTITGPPDANASPPGHYMLFLISGAGVPSVAQIVSVGNDACQAELSLTTFASYSDCEQTTNFTVSNPVNCQADYRWLVNGTYLPAYDGQPSLNWTTTSTSPTVQVQVEATRSCAGTPGPSGSSVNAYLGFTSYFPNCGAGCSGCGDPRPAATVQPTAGK